MQYSKNRIFDIITAYEYAQRQYPLGNSCYFVHLLSAALMPCDSLVSFWYRLS